MNKGVPPPWPRTVLTGGLEGLSAQKRKELLLNPEIQFFSGALPLLTGEVLRKSHQLFCKNRQKQLKINEIRQNQNRANHFFFFPKAESSELY